MDKDDIDFREWDSMYSKRQENCPFCNLNSNILTKNNAAIALEDKYPVTKYHSLVTPLRHVTSFFDLGTYEYNACIFFINDLKSIIIKNDRSVTGFNIGIKRWN
jgi:diadenosine tetraphosphate (Ap4A) HIT family hydrolase